MRIHTDTLTARDLHASLPEGVYLDVTAHGSRSRARAFEVTLYLYEKDDLHRRFGNSGGYRASTDVAATWDEWGIWLKALYELDSDLFCNYYPTYLDFVSSTRRRRDCVRSCNKPESLTCRTHTAPWLAEARTPRETLGVG
jgi:hypothetical protein